jgi:hypothetical protein
LWKNRLVDLDLLDLETGRTKEDRLKSDSIIVAKVHKKHKHKLKSVIVVPDSNSVSEPNKRRRISLDEYKTHPKRQIPQAPTSPPLLSPQSSNESSGDITLPQQGQQQMLQQQVQVQAQQQVKRVGKLGKEEQTIDIADQPPLTPNMLASANPQSSFRPIGSFVEAVLKKYGIEEETKAPLPSKWTETHPDWGTLLISEGKLQAIRELSIDLKSKHRLIIEQQDEKPPGGTYDKNIFIDFDWNKPNFPAVCPSEGPLNNDILDLDFIDDLNF